MKEEQKQRENNNTKERRSNAEGTHMIFPFSSAWIFFSFSLAFEYVHGDVYPYFSFFFFLFMWTCAHFSILVHHFLTFFLGGFFFFFFCILLIWPVNLFWKYKEQTATTCFLAFSEVNLLACQIRQLNTSAFATNGTQTESRTL
jgi:hypothetical protein